MSWYDPQTWATRIRTAQRQPSRTSQRLAQRQAEWRRTHIEPYHPPPTQRRRTLQEASRGRLTIPSIWGMVRKERAPIPLRERVKIPTERKITIDRGVSIAPGQMGLLAGAKAILPALREKIGVTKEYQTKQTQYKSQIARVEQLEKTHVRGETFVSPVYTSFQEKWQPYIKGKTFTGTEHQYGQFERERKKAEATQEREYKTYQAETTKLEQVGKELTETPKYWEEKKRAEIEVRHVTPLEKYRTYPIYKHGIGFARELRERVERGKEVWTEKYTHPKVREFIWRTPVTRELAQLSGGVVQAPPGLIEYVAHVPPGLEYLGREPKEFAAAVPVGAAVMARGLVTGLKTRPYATMGELAGMAFLTFGATKVVRPIIPKYIRGVKPTETGIITYKGVGIRGIKEPRPLVGIWKEVSRTPDITGIQRALVLGKEYPAVRYLKGVREAEVPMPELGLGARVFGKQTYTEVGIGRAIKYERMRMEGLWGKDYFLPERIAGVPEPVGVPTLKALPPPKPVLWERVGPTTLAKRVTTLTKTKQPKPIREWGIRIEKPDIPTYTELAKGRAYRIEKGYRAFQIGEYPTIFKTIGLGKGVPKFGKGITEIIHPFRKKVPPVYKPSMLDYQAPRGLLTEGLRLDMTMAKIRPIERPPSPIEKLYERITPEDIYRDFGVGRVRVTGIKAVLKPIETRFLKFTPEGELIPQLEVSIPKPKRIIEVATKISFDFKVMTDKAIKIATDTRLSTKTIVEGTTKEAKRAREAAKEGTGKIEAFGKMPISKGIDFGFPIIKGIPTYIPERVEKDKLFGIVIPGYEAAFKPHPIKAITPKEKRKEKERVFGLIIPKIQPAIEPAFGEEPVTEPVTEFEYKSLIPPPLLITTFEEPPTPPTPFVWGKEKKKKRKLKTKKQWEWLEEFTVQRPTELHFGAIESGIPKVSKVTMLPQITIADIIPKARKTKGLKGHKTNGSKKKKK